MKYPIAKFLILSFLLFSIKSFAYDFKVDELYYNILSEEDGTVEITRRNSYYYNLSGEFIIPQKIIYNNKTYTVKAIGDGAFSHCTNLNSIIIPHSVTSIGEDAFGDCSSLTSISFPNSITSIGSYAFGDCTGLTSISFPSSLTSIDSYAFRGCTGLTSFSFPSSVNHIGYGVFMDCTGLTAVSIPNSFTSIYGGMFSGCTGLTSVSIPNSVNSIGSGAFSGCTGLTSVSIPNSVTSIGNNAFYGCTGLTSISIPNSVTSIGNNAFSRCTGLTSIPISDSVTSIGEGAFYGCTGLISVTIPNSVISIGDLAFSDCTNIKSLTIGICVTSIGGSAFSYLYRYDGGSHLRPYTIPKVIWLGNTPPTGSSEIKAGINYVSNNEFSLSNQKVYPFLSSRFEVDNVVYVPVSPSERTCDVIDCNYAPTSSEIVIDSIVKNKNIELKVLEINSYSFYNNDSITKLAIKNSGNIGDYAFSGCSLLPEINLPDNIINIGKYAFSRCSSLKDVTIGRGIASLPEYVFSSCTSLPSIFIPSNITSINDYAFKGCTSLEDVTFEQNLRVPQTFADWTSTNHTNNSSSSHEYSIDVQAGDVLSFEIWSDCHYYNIMTVYLNGTSIATIRDTGQSKTITKTFSSAQTVSLKVEYTKYNSYSSGKNEAGIRNIALNDPRLPIALGSNGTSPLFSDCPLDEVVIGRKLSYKTSSDYGYSPFYRNTSLRSVKISDIEDTVYDNEFYGCSNLQEFECGDGVTSIGNWAFSGCSALKSYLSGTSVERIGQEAFSDCTAMTSFTTNAAVPPVCGNQALDDINKWECTLHVPQESIDDYQAAEQWKEFFFIETSGVDDVIADNVDYSECPVEIYNLSGNKVGSSKENLSPGIYIMRQGRKVEKIMIQ